MWLLALEACGALSVLIFIVWWTMYCGRKPDQSAHKEEQEQQHDPAKRE